MTDIRHHQLSDGDVSVKILSLGCITQDWRVPLNGQRVPVVLAYRDAEAYCDNPFFLGAIVGRVANRISGAAFSLDGRTFSLPANDGANHLHGGTGGLHTQNWQMEPDGCRRVQLRHVSPHGDQGYPGRVVFEVTISLLGHRLRYDMRAESDRPTPVNLAQHSYYNLAGQGTICDHRLWIAADAHTPTGDGMIPTGEIKALDGQEFDFRQGRMLARADPDQDGLDMNFVLNDPANGPAARLSAPNGLTLELTTDQPCLQLFTGTGLNRRATPLPGQSHIPFAGLCLEPQGFPDAPNQPGFASVTVTPDRPYRQRLDVRVAPAGAK